MKLHNFKPVLLTIIFLTIIFGQNNNLIKQKTFPTSPDKLLKVKAQAADIEVKSWDKGEIEIKIYGNKKAEKECEFIIDETSEGFFVEVKKEKKGWFFSDVFRNISIKIAVFVPTSFNLDLASSGGDILLNAIKGNFDLTTSGGDISFDYTNGNLIAKTSGGDITSTKHLGNIKLITSGGDISLKNIDGNIDSKTSGGDIRINSTNGLIDAATSGGDIGLTYSGRNKGIKLSTSGGDIVAKIDNKVTANVHLKTNGGSVKLDLDTTKLEKIKRSEIRAELNGGGEDINCYTSGGDIKIIGL